MTEVPEDPMDKLKEFFKELIDVSGRKREIRKTLQDFHEDEIKNFLFVAAGDGHVIKGMWFPDSAFEDEDIPLMVRGTEKDVIIAAWPRSYIVENMEKSDFEIHWDVFLAELVDIAVANMDRIENVVDKFIESEES